MTAWYVVAFRREGGREGRREGREEGSMFLPKIFGSVAWFRLVMWCGGCGAVQE